MTDETNLCAEGSRAVGAGMGDVLGVGLLMRNFFPFFALLFYVGLFVLPCRQLNVCYNVSSQFDSTLRPVYGIIVTELQLAQDERLSIK